MSFFFASSSTPNSSYSLFFNLSSSEPITAVIMNLLEALRHDQEKANIVKTLEERQARETDAVNRACIAELTQKLPEVKPLV